MFFGVGVSCRISFSIVSVLDVSCSGLVTSVEEERAYSSAIVYKSLCGFRLEGFLLLLGALNGLHFIVALPVYSLCLKYNYFRYFVTIFTFEQ